MGKSVFVALALVAFPASAFAGSAITTLSPTDETRVGIGLRFEFGDNAAEVVGSVRHTHTDTNNFVTGGLAEIAIPVITKKNHGPKIRAMGLAGSTCVQGVGGIGYDFANQQPLIGAGVQGPYSEAGANFLFNSELHPYIGLNSYGCAPDKTTTTTAIILPPG